jgi:hypothetical protein
MESWVCSALNHLKNLTERLLQIPDTVSTFLRRLQKGCQETVQIAESHMTWRGKLNYAVGVLEDFFHVFLKTYQSLACARRLVNSFP